MKWPSSQLGDHVEIISGFAFSSDGFNEAEGLPIVRIRDVVRGFTETKFRGNYDPAYLVQNGDTLVGMDGQFNVGTWSGGPALLNQRVCKIRARNTINQRFLHHFLPQSLKRIEDATSFVTVKHLSVKDIRTIPITLPPIEEQQRIAAILDQTETLRAKRRQALASLDTITQSLFQEMFSGIGKQSIIPLGELILTGPQNGLYRSATDYGSGIPILRIDSFYDGEVTDLSTLKRLRIPQSEIDRYELHENDLVINRVNSLEYLGKSAIVPPLIEPTVFESNMMRMRLDERRIHPVFAICALQTQSIRSQVLSRAKHAVNQSSINQTDVRALQVPLPPLKEQCLFVKIAVKLKEYRQYALRSQRKTDNVFLALQSDMFRGDN